MKKNYSDVVRHQKPLNMAKGYTFRAWCRSAIANVIAAKEGHKLLEAREFLKQQKKHRNFSANLATDVTEVKRVVGQYENNIIFYSYS